MYDTIEEIEALFNQEAESFFLEYKSGHVFDELSSKVRIELVKDVSAFANGGGGVLIVGVAEGNDGKRSIATDFQPVTNDKISVEQLTNIIKSNTDPVFSAFHIKVLRHSAGRIFVIEIDQADTAHQNRLDRLYYQRTGVVSEPMYDFAIRDVMNRRTHPRVKVNFEIQTIQSDLARQQNVYRVVPNLLNEGNITARHWALSVDLPADVAKNGMIHRDMPMRQRGNVKHNGIDYHRVELHSGQTLNSGAGTLLLPGQSRLLTLDNAFAEMDLDVNGEKRIILERSKPSVYWSFFLDDTPRKDGEVPFSLWCKN
ncbi:AlbA family DNA-binding domain-containing protein [Burkholderia sola]|uniref:AlbA family DNA-binding domain-containing protein n=1 Tax=Burkholderia sola TaxID=2843302 RepID=UPI0023DDBA4C|nr:ATP-binding protein [Burkholderia sola]MDF3086374.1 ATP-binding protein [Burkholderia sola]